MFDLWTFRYHATGPSSQPSSPPMIAAKSGRTVYTKFSLRRSSQTTVAVLISVRRAAGWESAARRDVRRRSPRLTTSASGFTTGTTPSVAASWPTLFSASFWRWWKRGVGSSTAVACGCVGACGSRCCWWTRGCWRSSAVACGSVDACGTVSASARCRRRLCRRGLESLVSPSELCSAACCTRSLSWSTGAGGRGASGGGGSGCGCDCCAFFTGR